MSFVIAAKGAESQKMVDGQSKKTIPFVGADREGEFAQMGVGLIFPEENKATIWGLLMPHALIQSWHAMKILEHIEVIEHGALCASWYAGGRDVHSSDEKRVQSLAKEFGSPIKFQAFRDEVLASVPGVDELDSMIIGLREKGVDIDVWELEREVKAGRILTSPAIEVLIKEDEARKIAQKLRDEEIKRPVPSDQSLAVFFADLGIDNFISGPAVGAYGFDWGHISLDRLEHAVKSNSLNKYNEKGIKLERTTKNPESFSARVGPGVTMHNTTFGDIEQPWIVSAAGARYTFLSAKYHDSRFFVSTLIERNGVMWVGEHTPKELREIIGPLPKKVPPPTPKTKWQKFVEDFKSFFQG